ncbi:MAG: PIN domain-containing protein [Candidatus Competibacteraceae bacterium]|nr:PIN domain-containing protein [Candidatus Competibacteraceae bacterium]
MAKLRTAIDANLLIAAWSGQGFLFEQALIVLEDPERVLIVSDALWLEVMPKALYHAQVAECAFYQAVFARAECLVWSSELVDSAKRLAQSYGLAAMDAIHIAVALAADADEFISGEKPGKLMFRVREINTRSLWSIRA